MEDAEYLMQLKVEARKLGLSLTALALKAGVMPSNLSRWRRGLSSPTLRILHRDMKKIKDVIEASKRQRLGDR